MGEQPLRWEGRGDLTYRLMGPCQHVMDHFLYVNSPHGDASSSRPHSGTFPRTLQKPSVLSVRNDPAPFRSYPSFKSKLKFLLFQKTSANPKSTCLCSDLLSRWGLGAWARTSPCGVSHCVLVGPRGCRTQSSM